MRTREAARGSRPVRRCQHGQVREMRHARLVFRALILHLAGTVDIVEIGDRDRDRSRRPPLPHRKQQRRGDA